MDNKMYYFKTIEECEKAIMDSALNIDIAYSSNIATYNAIIRFVKSMIIWLTACYTLYCVLYGESIYFIGKNILVFLIIYSILFAANDWTKYNFWRTYDSAKTAMINNLIMKCEEYCESNADEWQLKVIYENMTKYAYPAYEDGNKE
jgi:hypothetical protein